MVEAAGKEVAILFADVVGSTHLYEAMGDERARETVQQCLKVMREATEQFGGTVIKTMGDEIMATFRSADDAMNAGSQMQKRITSSTQTVAVAPMWRFASAVTTGRSWLRTRYLRRRGAYGQPHDLPGQGRPDPDYGSDRGSS